MGELLIRCKRPDYAGGTFMAPDGKTLFTVDANCEVRVPDDCGLEAAGAEWELLEGTPVARITEEAGVLAPDGPLRWFVRPESQKDLREAVAQGGVLVRFNHAGRGAAPDNCGLAECGYGAEDYLTEEELAALPPPLQPGRQAGFETRQRPTVPEQPWIDMGPDGAPGRMQTVARQEPREGSVSGGLEVLGATFDDVAQPEEEARPIRLTAADRRRAAHAEAAAAAAAQ